MTIQDWWTISSSLLYIQPLNSPFTYKHEWTNEGLACMTTAEALGGDENKCP